MENALRLNERFGLACLNDPESGRLLRNLRDLIRRTDSAMLQSGVVSACARCAGSKGSCCFREMGESYGSMGLFVNLLLGSALPEKTDFPGSCHFVGERGCKLQARQSFCLNYFCPDLKNSLGAEQSSGFNSRPENNFLQAGNWNVLWRGIWRMQINRGTFDAHLCEQVKAIRTMKASISLYRLS